MVRTQSSCEHKSSPAAIPARRDDSGIATCGVVTEEYGVCDE